MSDATRLPERHYLLGHDPHELARLDLQGALYREPTLHAFRRGGIESGMSVLDIGCGSGAVSLLAAEVVGDAGSVLGIDRGEDAIAAARAHASERGAENVTFERCELDDFDRRAAFDALVGRFILMHQPDPASVLRRLARAVRPGGPVVIVESWMELLRTGGHSSPHAPLYDRIVHWKSAVVSGAGADLHAGGRLRTTFRQAGLPDPTTRLDALVAGEADSPYWAYVEHSVRSMLPEAERLGLEGFDRSSVEGLGDRLRDEVLGLDGSVIAWPVVAAWSRAP